MTSGVRKSADGDAEFGKASSGGAAVSAGTQGAVERAMWRRRCLLLEADMCCHLPTSQRADTSLVGCSIPVETCLCYRFPPDSPSGCQSFALARQMGCMNRRMLLHQLAVCHISPAF